MHNLRELSLFLSMFLVTYFYSHTSVVTKPEAQRRTSNMLAATHAEGTLLSVSSADVLLPRLFELPFMIHLLSMPNSI